MAAFGGIADQELPTEGVDWTKLSANAGVDFAALRAKYEKMAASSSAAVSGKTSQQQEILQPTEEEEKIKSDYEKLAEMDVMRTCHVCHGTGIERFSYNFQVREQNCTGCDGEGLVRRAMCGNRGETPPQPSDISSQSSSLVNEEVAAMAVSSEDDDHEEEPPPMPM